MNQPTHIEHNPLQAQEPQPEACAPVDALCTEPILVDAGVLPPEEPQTPLQEAQTPPAPTHQAQPELPTTLNAAQEAAAFVARVFAEVAAPDNADTAPADLPRVALEPEDAAPILTAVPTDWPASAGPLGAVDADGQAQISKSNKLQGQQVLVLGLGASGLAMARWCVRCGAHVTVADTRAAPPQLAVLQQTLPQVQFVSGPMTAEVLGAGIQAVYRSPGLSPDSIAGVVAAAAARGLVVGGELDLYAAALADLRDAHGYAPAVLAITGTNGKTTVTSLTGQLVQRSGKTVAVAGNIGPTLLDTLASSIEASHLPQVWVLELSSFQLDGVTGFEPTAAAVLNVTQDHLDWHGDMHAYAAAKARIFGAQGLMVLNREDEVVMQMLPPPVRLKLQKPQQRPHLTFGADMPRRPRDYGIEVVNGMAWLVRAAEADETRKRSRSQADEEDLHIQRLMPADALRIRGRHNAVNALAALALACAAGSDLAPMLYGLREYRGEPHRVEPVATIAEVEFFDDSKGTNVGATVAALTGLGADRRIVVILGGDGKGQDFSPLAAPVSRYARAVVLIGRDAHLIQNALEGTGVAVLHAVDLPEAVGMAAQRAHAGDAVLLSPACASFDMFTGYEHRARVFCETVHALAEEAGQAAGGLA